LFFADTHLGFDYPLKPRIEKRRRGPDFFKNFDLVLEYAQKQKVNLIIHGGDLFYQTEIPEKIISLVYDRLFRIAETGISMLIVPGNHESSRLPGSLLTQHYNIHIFHKPETYYFEVHNLKLAISGFPFIRENILDNFSYILRQLKQDRKAADINLLCMHQILEGATVGPSDYTFRYGNDVISKKDLPPDYTAYLSGHIHRKQVIWKCFPNNRKIPFIYPGSIERTTFAEKDEVKGFYILEFSNNESDPALSKMIFHPLPTRPMVDMDLNHLPSHVSDNLVRTTILESLTKLDKDSIIRIKCKNPSILKILSSAFLKDLIPSTMNVQISGFMRKV